jgi:hypothetical protein
MTNYEYCTLTWEWTSKKGVFAVRFPDEKNSIYTKPTADDDVKAVELLNDLGKDGWEVASCSAGVNWMVWTLKRTAKK